MLSINMRSLIRICALVFMVHLLVACSQCSEKPEEPVKVDEQVLPPIQDAPQVEVEQKPEPLKIVIDSPAAGQTLYEGESAVFSGSVSGGIPPYVYNWDFPGSTDRADHEDPGKVTFSSAGRYEILFSVRDSSGIEAKASTVLDVVADTSPVVKIDSPKAGSVIPEGRSIKFAATVSNGNPPFTYEWDFSGLRPPSHEEDPGLVTFSEAGTYPVRLTVRDRDDDSHSASVDIVVEKNIPKAVITFPNQDMEIYQGETINFTCSVKDGNPPISYMWDFVGGAENTTRKDPGMIQFDTPGIFQVELKVHDVNNDIATDIRNITVIEDKKPAARIVSPEADVFMLHGRSVEFKAEAQGGNDPLSINWDFGGAAESSCEMDPGKIVFSTPGIYRITLSVTDANNDTISDSRKITVIEDTEPVVSIVSPCDGITITEKYTLSFMASVEKGNAPLRYQWDFSGANAHISEKDPGVIQLNTVGTFRVRFIASDLDGDVGSDMITIRVLKDTKPVAKIVSPDKSQRLYEGESVVFEGSVLDGNIPLKYLWDFKGGAENITVKNPGEVFFNIAGAYGVTFEVQDSDGDKDSDTVYLTVIKSTWTFVDGGWSHSVGLKTDGSLWSWGWNMEGQLGNGLTLSTNKPVHIGQDRDWKILSSGSAHSLGLKADGTLWAWGSNTSGQLGIGPRPQSLVPVQVGIGNDWCCVSAGSYHSLAVKTDGTLWSWGRNNEGQLGDGTFSYSIRPVRIGSDRDWKSAAAGEAHSVALKTDGTLWCWGSNELGQLGDGTQVNNPIPRQIKPETRWTCISAGKRHSLAITQDGALWAWGANLWGQLGDGTKAFKVLPVRIGDDSEWTQVSAGEYHSAGMKQDHSIWAWGWNAFGQLGTGTSKDSYKPVRIGNDTDWTWVTTGLHHTLAVKRNGTMWGWGYNGYGQLGDKTNEDKSMPMVIR